MAAASCRLCPAILCHATSPVRRDSSLIIPPTSRLRPAQSGSSRVGSSSTSRNAILRHVARSANLAGTTAAEAALVDVWLDHCEDVRKAYSDVIYGLDEPPFDDSLRNDDPRCVAAFTAHAPAVVSSFRPFERALEGLSVLVGAALTVADVALYDILDVHLRLWPDALAAAEFPRVHAHRAAVAAEPAIAAYLSGQRWGRLNGNALG